MDPAIRAMVPDVRVAGPALTVIAQDDHLPMFSALEAAAPGDVLVVVNAGGRRAVCGELFATEAKRRGVAGIVIDGCAATSPGCAGSGSRSSRAGPFPRPARRSSRAAWASRVRFGGVDVKPGDIVFGDDDGLVIAPPDRIAAALDGGEAIARAERAMLAAMSEGRPVHDLTSYAEHVARLDAGEESALEFRVD